MDNLKKLVNLVREKKAIFIVVASLVVSITTYSMILPAFTLDEEEAKDQGGIDIEEQVEKTSAKDTESVGNAKTEAAETEKVETKKESADEAHTIETKENGYGIVLSYDKDAKIPENAKLEADEIKDGKDFDELYDKAESAVKDAAGKDAGTKISKIKLYDISIKADGKEIEPESAVDVSIDYDKGMKLAGKDEKGTISIVHFTEDKNGKLKAELLDDKDYRTEIKNNTLKSCEFSAESFSVYGIIYTVDFEYEDEETGKTYEYSLTGGKKIMLSELAEKLGMLKDGKFASKAAFISEVKDVKFTDESLVKVTKDSDSNDWVLTSLKSFDSQETLTIVLNDGTNITVKVTDPATQDVSSLLTDVKINATQNPDGSYTVYAGQSYGIDLSFKEQPSGTQFDMTNGFYYPLPAGLNNLDALTGKAFIELSGGDHAGEKVEIDYHFEGNNLVFSWPDQTSPAYNQLKEAIYTNLKIHIEAKFDENVTELEFNDKITKNVDVKTDGKADVEKSGTYNPVTNSIDYTVYVKSTGICQNVVVADTISGTALTYNNDAVATSNKGTSVPTPTASGNGFTFTIPQMGDGEVVTVKYSAAVNLDALTRNDDGSLGTVTQTGNKVKVTPSNHPGDEDETSGKDFSNKISYSTINKTSSVGATGEDGHATVTWTIKANENANVSMAGHTISDMIDPASQSIMKYNGTGITIVRRDSNGNAVGSETIPWSNLTSHSDSAWTWTVPNAAPDTGKLSYEITYTTDVDANGQLFNTVVKNTGSSDNGGSSTGSGTVTPPGGALVARKAYISRDMTGEEKTVTWEVNFDVPATGLDSAVIDDTLPNYWNGSSPVTDDYKSGSITITPELAFGEGYEVGSYTDDAGQKHMTITFHKTVDEHQVQGLSGTGSKRKIRVQFQTVLNSKWLEASKDNPIITTHTNNANVILNGQTLGTQASTKIDVSEPEMTKTHGGETVNVVNSNTLPAWQFFVTLSGVSEDTFDENGQIVIEDTYNSRYLDWYPHAYPDWEKQNGQVWGGNSDYKFGESSADKVMSKIADGKLRIVLKQADLPRTDAGDYYPLYTVPYYLTVKDPMALQKMIVSASNNPGGAVPLYNTVTNEIFGEAEDRVDYEVPVVNKSATEPTLQNGVYKLHYTVDINSRALQLGDSDELVVTDEYSNISIDYTTVKIYEYINGAKTEVNNVIWDRSGYTSTYYFKNATHYVLEYDAHLSGEGERINNDTTRLTYTNTAEAFGKKSTWEKTKDIKDSGEGGSRTFRIKVLKHVKGNASQGLPGAVFQLWKYTPTADDPSGKDNRPDKDAAGWENTGHTLTTDSNGYAQTQDNMRIHSQTWYKLVETTPPQGYTLKTTHYFFWITEGQTADYSKYVYLNDDVLAINNTPELPKTVDVSVRKVWDDNSDTTLRKDVNVHLYAEGQPYNEYFSGEWAANARTDADVTLHLNEDGTSESYTWTGLPSGYTYSVVEDPVPGYTTTYSPKNTLTSGTLRITNKRNLHKTAISIDKEWKAGATPSEDVTLQLKRKVSANAPIVIQNGANGAGATGMHIKDYSVPAGATVNLIWTFKNSWGYDSPALNIYNYGTKELIQHIDEISGNPTQHTLQVTVPSEGIIVAFEKVYLDSEDSFTRQFDFETQVTSTGTGAATEDVNFTNERHYLTLSPDNNWHLDVDGLVVSDEDGAYTYYVEEIGVNDNTQTPQEAGYVVSYTNNNGITNGTIKVTNEKEPPAKVQVTKAFSGINALPSNFRITNNYNNEVFTASNAVSGDGTTENPYTWIIDEMTAGTEVTFTETGATVDGYDLTITANGTAQAAGSTSATATATAARVTGDGAIPTASFVNTYKQQKGSVKVTKVFSGIGSLPSEFKITNSYNETEFTVSNRSSGEGTADAPYTWVINEIPVGTEVTFTESGVSIDGYNLTITANGTALPEGSITGEALVVSASGDEIPTATFVNDYIEQEEPLGSLEITKNIQKNGTINTAATGTFYYAVYAESSIENGVPKSDAEAVRTGRITVSESDNGTKTVSENDLPYGSYYVFELTGEGGEPIISGTNGYVQKIGTTVYKVAGSGTTATVGDTDGQAVINNSEETIKAKVVKIWDDNNDAKEKRPESLTAVLYAHSAVVTEQEQASAGTEKATVTLNEENQWTSDVIENLPVYDDQGNEIAYHWVEGNMPHGYFLTSVSNNTVEGVVTTTLTNTLRNYDLTTSYVGVKTWEDNGNAWNTRPSNLTIKLYKIEKANGTYPSTGTEVKGVEPEWNYNYATNQWQYTFNNLQVFDDNGEVIKYYTQETAPSGYVLKDGTGVPDDTDWKFGTVHAVKGGKVTQDSVVEWNLGSLIDLSFIIVKTTDQDFVVWTHRIPTQSELNSIHSEGARLFGDYTNKNKIYVNGIGTISTTKGNLTIDYDDTEASPKVTLSFSGPNVWSQYAKGQFNNDGKSAYNPGTTNYTNTLEQTELSGEKTWNISGSDNIDNAENITLKLTRTTSTSTTPEIIYAKSATEKTVYSHDTTSQLLQPVWNGNDYKFANLPAKDSNGNEYTYSVAEWQFTVGDYTYSVDAEGHVTKSNTNAPDMTVSYDTQTEGKVNIINTETKSFEFSKIWNDFTDQPQTWPEGASITVSLSAYTDSTTKEAVIPVTTLTFKPGEIPEGWTMEQSNEGKTTTFKTTGLAAKHNNQELTYYVVETKVSGYKDPSYAGNNGAIIVEADRALDRQQIINTPEESVELPSAGGPGTHWMYMLGILLVLASAIAMLARYKAEK